MRPILYTGVLLMVAAACTGIVESPDEGTGGDSTGVAVCSSNIYWKDLDHGSEFMHPGGKCNTCHDADPTKMAPNFTMAGTVYPTSHEPDDCNGVNSITAVGNSDVTIVITDASQRTLMPIPVNSAGNFKYEAEIIKPFNVKVVNKGKESKMMMTTTSGDCNSCHTQGGGQGAPGRIVAP